MMMPLLRCSVLLLIVFLTACAGTPRQTDTPPDTGTTVLPEQPEQAAGTRNPDPWERWNRKVHRFNSTLDRYIMRPVARGYVRVVPAPVRTGIGNMFSNLGQPLSAVNALLQGKPKRAGQSLARFALNLTLGIGGLFDPASDAKLPRGNEDFGQTLAMWGWKQSRYLELPLLGPRTVRDSFGLAADMAASPLRRIDDEPVRYGLGGLSLVDTRAQLLTVDSLRTGVPDDYALLRDAWLQRRQHQIFDREGQQQQVLPDYLLDDWEED